MTWDFILLWELNCYCCVMLHVSLPSRPSQQVQIKRATNTVSVHLQMTEKVEELWSQLFCTLNTSKLNNHSNLFSSIHLNISGFRRAVTWKMNSTS